MSNEDDKNFYIEDNVNYKSISCENIPELFLDKLIAKKHFGRFGRINKFILRPNRLSCTIDFETESEAENAFLNAGNYNGVEFKLRYTELEEAHVRNTEEWVDSDVQAELESMRNMPSRQRLQPPFYKFQNIKSYPKPILKTKSTKGGDVPKIDGVVKAELDRLESILSKPAITIEDRYDILDARDKLIRLKTIRTTDIRKAISTIGTCPDMCPEKERLARETRNQVSFFELGFNGMDYKIAVKEYSRSSADQETPLAHELRPEPVLNMTMNYLLHNIMDLCENDETNLRDWYHFVWDRTRSIRKDITQQDLCSLKSVNLVEQCARFHIHCAARLIAEDVSVFDQKINTENLTKCLQTLKYMYHDLRLKYVKCPNESEFRSYIILLNLNDTNFLWEVNQLPDEIQNSKEIQEAISFYISMESNNYVKFFKLIKQTSYMNACILLRYFHQVRNRALQTILKAYNWSKTVFLPISYLANILAFESEKDAISYFTFYNLECTDDKVKIDKNSYYIPDEPFYMERSLTVVEAKRNVSIGELICGKSLDPPTFEDREPHCSFEQNGLLKLIAWTAEDQSVHDSKLIETERFKTPKVNVDVIDNVFKIPTSSPPISPKVYQQKFSTVSKSLTPNDIKVPPSIEIPIEEHSINTKIITDSTSENVFVGKSTNFFMPSKPVQFENIFRMYKSPQLTCSVVNQKNIFLHDETQSKQADLSIPSRDKEFQQQHSFKLPSFLTFKQPVVSTSEQNESNASHYYDNNKIDENKESAEYSLQNNKKSKVLNKLETEMEHKIKMEKINQKSLEIFESILKEIENDELQKIAESELQKNIEILQKTENYLNDIIDEIVQEVIRKIINEELKSNQDIVLKYFKQWKLIVIKNIHRRNLINSVPTWTQPEPLDEFAIKIAHPALEESLQEMKRYRLGKPKDFNLNLENKFSKIDIISILSEKVNLNQNLKKGFFKHCTYLKLILSIPGELEEIRGFESYFNKFLNESILQPKSILKNSKNFFCSNKDKFSICLRKITGIIPKNEQNKNITTECDNANGMIFVMSSVDVDSSRRRLHHILKLSLLFNTQIPLAIMLYKPHLTLSIIDDLKLTDIYNNFDYVKIFACNENTLTTAFIDCLKFLGSNIENPCDLEMQNLIFFMQITICNEFWKRLNDCWKMNPAFKKFCTIPQNVINLFNDAIDRLCIIAEEDFYEYIDFPEELTEFVPKCKLDIPLGIEYFPKDWKTKRRALNIGNFLRKNKLKPWVAKSMKDVNELETEIMNYCRQYLFNNTASSSIITGYPAIKEMFDEINTSEKRFYSTFKEKLESMSWLNIFQAISLELLNNLWNCENNLLPTEIVYNKNKLLDYLETPWWLSYKKINEIKVKQSGYNEKLLENRNNKELLASVFEKANELIEQANKKIENYQNISQQKGDITKSIDLSLYKFKKMEMANKLKTDDGILHRENANNISFIPVNFVTKKRTHKELYSCEQDVDENINSVIAKAMKILEKVENSNYMKK